MKDCVKYSESFTAVLHPPQSKPQIIYKCTVFFSFY